jgi:hypothetical protein
MKGGHFSQSTGKRQDSFSQLQMPDVCRQRSLAVSAMIAALFSAVSIRTFIAVTGQTGPL